MNDAAEGSLLHFLDGALRRAVAPLGAGDAAFADPPVTVSDRPDLSDYQSSIALKLTRQLRRPPREIAALIQDNLHASADGAFTVRVDGPGFINISLTDDFLARRVTENARQDALGVAAAAAPQTIVVDYGGPNVAKSMHVGHLRSTVIGGALMRIGAAMGHRMIGDVHLGDWGTQMGLLIEEIRLHWPDAPCFDPDAAPPFPEQPPLTVADLEKLYPQAATRAREDADFAARARAATFRLQAGEPGLRALWRRFVDLSTATLKQDFAHLNAHFDLWWGESTVHDRIPPMIERAERAGAAVVSDGALVTPLGEDLPPLILQKSDGAVMYGTTDLATIDARMADLHADRVLYVVDHRQALHFRQVFLAAERIGLCEAARLEHIGFGTVNGPDGKPFKTRTGGVMRLRDLLQLTRDKVAARINEESGKAMDEETLRRIAVAALKFADLMNHYSSSYSFDPDRFTKFEGRTGPYLLYTLVRFRAILKRAGETPQTAAVPAPRSAEERDILLLLARYPDSFAAAWRERAPNLLCDFAFNLAQAANRLYAAHAVLTEQDPARRGELLTLVGLTARYLEAALDALAIETVEEM